MTSRQLIILLVVLIGLGIIFTAGKLLISNPATGSPSPTPTISGEPVACTMDAKICPDGSAVGRIGPNCEFAMCPATGGVSTSTGTSGSSKAILGAVVSAKGVSIKPVEVVEDSRCPADVQCIQAGTVRVRAELSRNGPVTIPTFTLNQPFTYGTSTVTLTQVTPAATKAGQKIPPASYQFTFEVR